MAHEWGTMPQPDFESNSARNKGEDHRHIWFIIHRDQSSKVAQDEAILFGQLTRPFFFAR